MAARNFSRSGHSEAVTTTSALRQLWPALCVSPVTTCAPPAHESFSHVYDSPLSGMRLQQMPG